MTARDFYDIAKILDSHQIHHLSKQDSNIRIVAYFGAEGTGNMVDMLFFTLKELWHLLVYWAVPIVL